MKTFPPQGQVELLIEHGLYDSLAVTWANIEDINEVTRRLGVAPEATLTCDFATAMRSYQPSAATRCFWITRHAPDWCHVLTLSGTMPSPETLSLNHHSVFELACNGGIDEIYPLSYTYDGISDREFFEIPEYVLYWDDLESRPFMPTAEELEQYLIIIGRITGRFYDREWFSSPGLLCTLPHPRSFRL